MIHEGWALVCELSLWGWIAATVGFILCSFPARNVFKTRPASIWGTCLIIFYVVWIVSMIKA